MNTHFWLSFHDKVVFGLPCVDEFLKTFHILVMFGLWYVFPTHSTTWWSCLVYHIKVSFCKSLHNSVLFGLPHVDQYLCIAPQSRGPVWLTICPKEILWLTIQPGHVWSSIRRWVSLRRWWGRAAWGGMTESAQHGPGGEGDALS